MRIQVQSCVSDGVMCSFFSDGIFCECACSGAEFEVVLVNTSSGLKFFGDSLPLL